VDNDAAAWLGLVTALVLLATAVATLVLTFRNRKKVQEIHVLVNAQNTDLNTRIDQLTRALVTAGLVPPAREGMEEK
jgi:hypothetical protein